jgi:hypothetical protein
MVGCFFQRHKFIVDCSSDIKMQIRKVLTVNFGITSFSVPVALDFFIGYVEVRPTGRLVSSLTTTFYSKGRRDKLNLDDCLIQNC